MERVAVMTTAGQVSLLPPVTSHRWAGTQPSQLHESESDCLLQVVWAGSTHIGVASAVRGNAVYVVANYQQAMLLDQTTS